MYTLEDPDQEYIVCFSPGDRNLKISELEGSWFWPEIAVDCIFRVMNTIRQQFPIVSEYDSPLQKYSPLSKYSPSGLWTVSHQSS